MNNFMPCRVRYLALVAGATALVACAPVQIDRPDQLVRGHMPDTTPTTTCLAAQNVHRLGAAQDNELAKNCIDTDTPFFAGRQQSSKGTSLAPNNLPFSGEWAFNKQNRHAPPKVCLALSGGGVRSASFSMGILKALSLHASNEARPNLDQVDVVSSVSGGGYALAWLIMQYYHHRADPAFSHRTLFLPNAVDGLQPHPNGESQYVRYLENHATIMTPSGYVSLLGVDLLTSPINFGLNGLFGSHTNTTPSRGIYENRLKAIYARDPSHQLEVPDNVSFNELLRYYYEHRDDAPATRAPFFIINTTAFIEEDLRHHGAALANSIYDFTILQYGSDALGRYVYSNSPLPDMNELTVRFAPGIRTSYPADELREGLPMSFMRAISVSGAALDGSALVAGPSQRALFSLANIDLGFYINNPGLTQATRQHHRLLPFPFYYFNHYARDVRGTDIYLSDGGHAENLGAFSLVRRLCEEIIIVDAEYDPSYEFEAYTLLKRSLLTQMGILLKVDEIDNQLRAFHAKQKPCLDAVANERDSSLPKFASDVNVCSDSPRWKEIAAHPVMEGKICCLPLAERDELSGKPITVHYIKLAYYAECDRPFDTASHFVKDYFCRKKGEHHPFPQYSTKSQNYREEDFRAYMALGLCVMNQAYWSHWDSGSSNVLDCASD